MQQDLEDERVEVYLRDRLRFLRNCENEYDIIINDATDPPGTQKGCLPRNFTAMPIQGFEGRWHYGLPTWFAIL